MDRPHHELVVGQLHDQRHHQVVVPCTSARRRPALLPVGERRLEPVVPVGDDDGCRCHGVRDGRDDTRLGDAPETVVDADVVGTASIGRTGQLTQTRQSLGEREHPDR